MQAIFIEIDSCWEDPPKEFFQRVASEIQQNIKAAKAAGLVPVIVLAPGMTAKVITDQFEEVIVRREEVDYEAVLQSYPDPFLVEEK